MQDFAIQILRHMRRGGVLDHTAYAAIRAICIRNLKGIEARGVSLEQEANTLNEALRLFPEMMDLAVALGRE